MTNKKWIFTDDYVWEKIPTDDHKLEEILTNKNKCMQMKKESDRWKRGSKISAHTKKVSWCGKKN